MQSRQMHLSGQEAGAVEIHQWSCAREGGSTTPSTQFKPNFGKQVLKK
jgi:hypothetical protein